MQRPILTARQRRRPSLTVYACGLAAAALAIVSAAQTAGVL